MANNQYINKVVFGNQTLMDLTSDTVAADKLLRGYTAHDASGASIVGTYEGGGGEGYTINLTASSSELYGQDIVVPSTEYTVTYANNTTSRDPAQPATVTVTAKESGNYKGSNTANFQITEAKAIDASMITIELLNLIVANAEHMLNRGISLNGITQLGNFLRTKGDKVDFVKLDTWLQKIHLRRFAQLEGSILITVFAFEPEEIPFVERIEPAAYQLTIRTLTHTAIDTAKEWHFRQRHSGFVENNSKVLRRNLRRSIRYIVYSPIETTSNFVRNFARSLSEIEE